MSFDLGSITAKITADLSGFQDGLNQAKSGANDLQTTLGNVSSAIGDFAKQAAVFTGAVVAGFSLIAKTGLDDASSFEHISTSFTTMLGSASEAQALLQQLSNLAANSSSLTLDQVQQGALHLISLGMNTKDVLPLMQRLGDMASVVGGDQFPTLVDAMGKLEAGTGSASRTFMAFTSAGVPLAKTLSEMLDMPVKQVTALANSGKLTGDQIEAAFIKMTSAGGEFFQGNSNDLKTWNGLVNEAKNQFTLFLDQLMGVSSSGNIDENGPLAKMRDAVVSLVNTFNANKPQILSAISTIETKIADFVKALQPLIEWITSHQALVKTFLEGLAIGIGALLIIGTITALVIALLNPLVLVAGAIAALYIAWQTNFMGFRDVTQKVVNEVVNFFDNYLIPLFDSFVIKFRNNWTNISLALTDVWDVMKGTIQVAWSIIYGIIKVGIDLLTGNWSQAWTDIKGTAQGIWDGLKNIFTGISDMIQSWAKDTYSALTKPFDDAWNTIQDTMSKIKDALDFTKRHSPSVLDIVQSGVSKVNTALSGLAINNSFDLSPAQSLGNFSGNLASSTLGQSIVIDMSGAIIADSSSAMRMGEIMGDAMIKKLQINQRF